MFRILQSPARSILSATTGFIRNAGFTHSLTPARNCTYGCTYCYVPTMGFYGGLQPEDWRRWGQFTTYKENAPDLLASALRGNQVIYCSPTVDPYQPAERTYAMMPRLLDALAERPPRIFVIQTRGPLIVRDLERLRLLATRTLLRVSFSITTDDDSVRRRFEPLCEPNEQRLDVVRQLNAAGIETYTTLAPILPCDPERLAALAMDASPCDLVGDPFHVRATKPAGATTREAALRIASRQSWEPWLDPAFQAHIIERIRATAALRGRRVVIGPEGFSLLARH
jgi:DNA repair photolyase